MKILHVYKDFDPPIYGGIEGHMALSCRFQQAWAEVEALTCSREIRTTTRDRCGTKVTEVGEWGRFQGAPVAPTFPYHLRAAAADVTVIHSPNPTAEIAWLLARPRGTLVVRYHSDVIRQARAMQWYRPLFTRFLQQAAVILPTSEHYLNSSPFLAPVRAQCRAVPLGILPERFPAPDGERLEALRQRYGGPFVLFTGRHRYYKGLSYLVEAARFIQIPVVIAGDGPEREKTMQLAGTAGVPVHFPGHLDHDCLVDHLHACEVFVFPSVERSEAFGMSIMEAHACGKAVVATQLGTGVEFINEHGKTGLNVPPRDAGALAAAVNELLAAPETRQTMGHYARTRIQTTFHASTLARQEFNLYQEARGWTPRNPT